MSKEQEEQVQNVEVEVQKQPNNPEVVNEKKNKETNKKK
jgi:hypothetical protein